MWTVGQVPAQVWVRCTGAWHHGCEQPSPREFEPRGQQLALTQITWVLAPSLLPPAFPGTEFLPFAAHHPPAQYIRVPPGGAVCQTPRRRSGVVGGGEQREKALGEPLKYLNVFEKVVLTHNTKFKRYKWEHREGSFLPCPGHWVPAPGARPVSWVLFQTLCLPRRVVTYIGVLFSFYPNVACSPHRLTPCFLHMIIRLGDGSRSVPKEHLHSFLHFHNTTLGRRAIIYLTNLYSQSSYYQRRRNEYSLKGGVWQGPEYI